MSNLHKVFDIRIEKKDKKGAFWPAVCNELSRRVLILERVTYAIVYQLQSTRLSTRSEQRNFGNNFWFVVFLFVANFTVVVNIYLPYKKCCEMQMV